MARNIKSMRLPLAAIFFMTYFNRAGGGGGATAYFIIILSDIIDKRQLEMFLKVRSLIEILYELTIRSFTIF